VIEDVEPKAESDLRRRAAWLLAMLAVVAVLVVIVMSALLGTHGTKHGSGSGPLDSAVTGPTGATSSAPRSGVSSSTASHPATTAASTPATASCPTTQRCALGTDIGNAVAAINAYRTQHGQSAVPGAVSAAAQQCALSNGSGCSGRWAESQVPGPSGAAAVQKIIAFGKLLDPQLKSIGVGWAYDPQSKQYFFAIVRND
jgi:hypothetical protein